MVTRILIQKKVFDIRCMSDYLSGHGFSWSNKGIDFIKEQEWQSDEECNKLLQHYTQEWKEMREKAPHTTTSCAPEISIYWKTIKNLKPLGKFPKVWYNIDTPKEREVNKNA